MGAILTSGISDFKLKHVKAAIFIYYSKSLLPKEITGNTFENRHTQMSH